MEDILKFLLVVAVITLGIARQSAKKTKKETHRDFDIPTPDSGCPQPELWENGSDGSHIPERAETKTEPTAYVFQSSTPRKQPGSKKQTSQWRPETSSHTSYITTPQVPDLQDANEESEFSIRSAEEARKAIIWSEILRRKY